MNDDTPNASERDFWSGPSGRSWITYEDEQDTFLHEAATCVLHEATPGRGDRILDIGCGTGALSILAAGAVGPEGRVLATDISEPLLGRTARRAADLPQVSTHLADAQTTDWPETGFDFAISRFGVMFFADPPAAFANIARALKPGGRMVFAAWAPAADNPYWSIPPRRAGERLGFPPRTEPDTPGPMGLSTLPLAIDRLRAGGLTDVEGRAVTLSLRHPGGIKAAADLSVRVGAGRRVINVMGGTEEDEAAIRAAIESDYASFAAPDGTAAIPATINLLTARVPD
jgi:SAM-dependent methyltransferase